MADKVKRHEKTGITAAFLRECFVYEPDTGLLRWQLNRPVTHFLNERTRRSNNARWGGRVAGIRHKRVTATDPDARYIMLWVQEYRVAAHRVVWAIAHDIDLDAVPPLLDHQDGNGENNCVGNLRPATKPQNGWNQGVRRSNTSGYKGVNMKGHKYIARITVSGNRMWLGAFGSPEAAHEAYRAAALKYHGEFARP
jgi:hypothetical protein